MRIRERATQYRTTSSDELSEELNENARITRALNLAEQASTSSSSSLFGSFEFSNSLGEVEFGEEVNQGKVEVPEVTSPETVPAVALILVKSFGLEAADDLNFPLVQPAVRDLIGYSFTEGGDAETNSDEVYMAPKT